MSRKWGALQAVLDAAFEPDGDAGPHRADPCQTGPDIARPTAFIEQRYAALLSRLMVGEQRQSPQRVLFVAACPRTHSTPIALGVTRAAAALVGRTVLVDGWAPLPGCDDHAAHLAGIDGEVTPRVLPDAYVPRLHHYRLGACASDAHYLFGPRNEDALAALAASFRFVAIDSAPPSAGPVANALARSCSACVVVVGAGVTSQAAMTSTLLDLKSAGATIIGAILAGAGDLPSWAGGHGAAARKSGRILA
jgi:Mrp family chromosome partitioning ATPase